jgi:membrane protease YdiL (CAAX protease family)
VSAAATARTHAAPPGPELGRMTGRQLAAGTGLSVLFAAVLGTLTSLAARAAAPHWARTDGLTVLIVAEVYLAVIAGLVIAAGGPARARDLLAIRRPGARQLPWSLIVLLAAVAAGLAVSLAFSPLTGGITATLKEIVRSGSDETRMPTATPLVWALIVIRLAALTGPAEELFFRGALYGWLRRYLPVAATITVTAGLFGLEHAYYPVLLPLVLSYGLAAGWVRHRTQSTVTTIAMHVTVDFALFAAAAALS